MDEIVVTSEAGIRRGREVGNTVARLEIDEVLERVPVGPVHTDAETALDVNADRTLSADISFPAEAKIGQYCVAYGIASDGTAPYEFTWSGQFSNADAEDGPLGPNQIASGNLSRYNRLFLTVEDAEGRTAEADPVSWDWTDEYNPDCAG